MTQIIARGISETVSAQLYPLFAPFVGTLGAFMTGSNANSNVVFGALQQETAALLGLSVPSFSRARPRAGHWAASSRQPKSLSAAALWD